MSKDEVSLLVDLIQSHPVVITKETNAATNKLKEESWISLTNKFNSKSGQIPRQVGQLKLKWDNLKKAARKRAANIRMNNLKTGGGKPDFIPPDEILEKVASVLGPTCSGFDVPFGGDGVGATENVNEIFELDNADWMQIPEQLNTNVASVNIQEESLLPTCPKKRKIDDSSQAGTSEGNTREPGAKHIYGMMSKPLQSKAKKFKTNQDDGRLQCNLAMARYYDKKAEKLDIEIKILKLELANKEKNCNNNI
ncbi:uncharacterized protein LOC126912100 [Spodoptera frugiperda]|uniref:Regulatory protein zeste n=1 Tax=Spodoptera frugiperda TaxID=7108 RepID=A0A9R0F0V7_SPOFR|nr:uncharacterized protein LOC126912100 [Spodoptera frugiperda]